MSQGLSVRRGASTQTDTAEAAAEFLAAIEQPDTALVVFFAAPQHDLDALAAAMHARYPDTPVVGCSTAGEISPLGYLKGSLTGVSIASPDITVSTAGLEAVSNFEFAMGADMTLRAVSALESQGVTVEGDTCFAMLLVDGVCRMEEQIVSAVYRSLGNVQLFGGSAGDNVDFEETLIYHDGTFERDRAVLTLIHTTLPFEIFRTQHFVPSERKLVITEARPAERIATEINGYPAGREYARIMGIEVGELSPTVFANHPVMVKVGGEYFVRSVMQVMPDESMQFACAIDEGIVLTVAEGVDLVSNLQSLFEGLTERLGRLELVLGCDCLFRTIEMERKGIKEEVAAILQEHGVIGFSTYGEQINAMHVNQTFTGVAIGGARS